MAVRSRHVLVVLILALVLGSCGDDGGKETTAATTTTTTAAPDDLTRFCQEFAHVGARLGETLNLSSPPAAAEWARGVAAAAREAVAGAPAQVRPTLTAFSAAAEELGNYMAALPQVGVPDPERLRQLNSRVFTGLQEVVTSVSQSCAGVNVEPPPAAGGSGG